MAGSSIAGSSMAGSSMAGSSIAGVPIDVARYRMSGVCNSSESTCPSVVPVMRSFGSSGSSRGGAFGLPLRYVVIVPSALVAVIFTTGRSTTGDVT